MQRVIPVSERNVRTTGAAPVAVPDSVAKDVLPDQTGTLGEICQRTIQNAGANTLYYAIGQDASPANYNGILTQYQQYDASVHRMRVSVYCVGGTTVAVTVLRRNDLGHNNTIIPGDATIPTT